MVETIAEGGGWRVAIRTEEAQDRFEPIRWAEKIAADVPKLEMTESESLLVEVMSHVGGTRARAALGGVFVPGGGEFRVRLALSGEITLGASPDFRSLLWTPLVSGVPSEFERAILDEVLQWHGVPAHPSGYLDIRSGGYDEVDSSSFAFAHAARLLIWSVVRSSRSLPIDVDAVRQELHGWRL